MRSRTLVRSSDRDPGVLAQAEVELAVADVDGHHRRRPPLEEAVGEAAGGRPRRRAPAGPRPSTSKRSRAASSLSPPRPTNRAGGPASSSRSSGATRRAGLSAGTPPTRTRPGLDVVARPVTAGRQPPPDQLGVEPPAQGAQASRRPAGAPGTRRPPARPRLGRRAGRRRRRLDGVDLGLQAGDVVLGGQAEGRHLLPDLGRTSSAARRCPAAALDHALERLLGLALAVSPESARSSDPSAFCWVTENQAMPAWR